MPTGVVQKDQRTLLLVYAAPGPAVTEEDTNVDDAAKLLPGIAQLVQSSQDEKDLASSKNLQQFLPAWKPDEKFHALLRKELAGIGYAGRFVTPEEAELPAQAFKELNRASDELDWRLRYYLPNPDAPVPRDYSKFLSLAADDALVLEINLMYGVVRVPQSTEGIVTPHMGAMLKFYRAGTMRQLWQDEETLSDTGAAKSLYEFESEPQTLMDSWNKLMPQLAGKLASDFKLGLTGAPVHPLPGQAPAVPAVSTGPARGVAVSTSAFAPPTASTAAATVAVSTAAVAQSLVSTTTLAVSTAAVEQEMASTATLAVSTAAVEQVMASTATATVSTEPFSPPLASTPTYAPVSSSTQAAAVPAQPTPHAAPPAQTPPSPPGEIEP